LWDGVSAKVDNKNDEKVFVQAIYPAQSPDFHDVAVISKDLIIHYSNDIPGIRFPFSSFIAFNNGRTSGGGMEFPMMINDGSYDVRENTISLTAHEIAHQYFPFYVGTNEQKYAFMDEGWASMLPFSYMENLTGKNSRLIGSVKAYENIAGSEDDVSPIISSVFLSYSSYRNSGYDRPSIAYYFLYDMLGKEIFLEALQEFMNRWSGKHPTPYDFFFTFNEVTGQDLNWFWKPWFFKTGYPDMKIEIVSLDDKPVKIEISKVGTVPTPIKITLNYEDDFKETFYYSTDVWEDEKDSFTIETDLKGILKEITLGDSSIPDSNEDNNIFVAH
jgi:aminopeptidase N